MFIAHDCFVFQVAIVTQDEGIREILTDTFKYFNTVEEVRECLRCHECSVYPDKGDKGTV